jgi:hypothetical protein
MIQLAGFGAGPFSKPMHTRILRSSNCLLDGYFSCKQLLNPGNANTINPRPIQHGVQNVLSLFSNYWNYWTSKSKSLKKSAFPYISPTKRVQIHLESMLCLVCLRTEESPSPKSPIESPSPSEVRELEELVEELTETLRFHESSSDFFLFVPPKNGEL